MRRVLSDSRVVISACKLEDYLASEDRYYDKTSTLEQWFHIIINCWSLNDSFLLLIRVDLFKLCTNLLCLITGSEETGLKLRIIDGR